LGHLSLNLKFEKDQISGFWDIPLLICWCRFHGRSSSFQATFTFVWSPKLNLIFEFFHWRLSLSQHFMQSVILVVNSKRFYQWFIYRVWINLYFVLLSVICIPISGWWDIPLRIYRVHLSLEVVLISSNFYFQFGPLN
jgi:hypothetical protein